MTAPHERDTYSSRSVADNDVSSLADAIQRALQNERQLNPKLYEPQPGQIPSHVDHRVARITADVAERWYEAQWEEPPTDRPRRKRGPNEQAHEHTLAEQPPTVELTPTDVVAMLKQEVNELQFKLAESQRQVEELHQIVGQNRDLDWVFLCEDTFREPVHGRCEVHGGDACLFAYMKVSKIGHALAASEAHDG